jgi:hypothetical protein
MDLEGLFGHVNDSIRKVASQGPATQRWDFICECPDTTCHELVSLTLLEFDERRSSSPPQPVTAARHAA